ncbi:MAG: hypothetical protein OXC31_05125, partial [Spirochaetaceae bacterium]|nr:hypothetical protein [Spirochaetaceae bacterium]
MQPELAELRRLSEAGATDRQAGKHFGRNEPWARKLRLKHRIVRHREAWERAVDGLVSAGVDRAEAEEMVGRSIRNRYDEPIRWLIAQGYSASQAAILLDAAVGTLKGCAGRLGIPFQGRIL